MKCGENELFLVHVGIHLYNCGSGANESNEQGKYRSNMLSTRLGLLFRGVGGQDRIIGKMRKDDSDRGSIKPCADTR